MFKLKQIGELVRRTPVDVVGIDLGSSGVKVVRARKTDEGPVVVGTGVFPRPSADGGADARVAPIALTSRLRSRYASLAVSGARASVKLLSFHGAFDSSGAEKIAEALAIAKPDEYRIGYQVLAESRAETRILAVGLPEEDAQAALALVPAGVPAPFSIEVSGLAALTAFVKAQERMGRTAATGLLDFGAASTTLALFSAGALAFVRRFDTGTDPILARIRDSLGVDDETARGIIADGAFDVSQSVAEVMDEITKQLVVSRDFVERRENCHVGSLFVSGNKSVLQHAVGDMASAVGVEVSFWDPFEGLKIADGAMSPEMTDQKWRLSAALGACLATLEG
ncbi:MAG: hypothetical protein FJ225_10550 [Lentisphaerae bacterium]|nr:hypothetical protein [Lentisphaerota bacterium]